MGGASAGTARSFVSRSQPFQN